MESSKYQTPCGVPCTKAEEKLIDSFKRLARRWKRDGGEDLMLFVWGSNGLKVVKKSEIDGDCVSRAIVEDIHGIYAEGGDPS